ncbi:MAG: peptidase M48 [Actinobacteria bacterium]|nr:peptidase M48 [Actinomycetota bacterium]
MNPYLLAIIALYSLSYLLSLVVDWLNINAIKEELPKEFEGVYDQERYSQSQVYLKTTTRFGLIKETVFMAGIFILILSGAFNHVDLFVRTFELTPIPTGLAYFLVLSTFSFILQLPFTWISTFYIEAKYGFNRTTLKTFISDHVKGVILGLLMGGLILSLILWFFTVKGEWAWLWAWGGLSLLQVAMMVVYPVLILPLFNRFEPLDDSELKTAIMTYSESQRFHLKGIFKMDGSKRSTKTNAFFTGIGRFRRVVLFDTLINVHTVSQLVAIVAHEIGHYKRAHIYKMIVMNCLSSLLMFFVLGKFINHPGLFDAFQMQHLSIYASLVFFSILFGPIDHFLSLITNFWSRRYEFEADAFVVQSTGQGTPLIEALKKLSVDNLSNLTPHPIKVAMEYSHPPVLARIKAIRQLER